MKSNTIGAVIIVVVSVILIGLFVKSAPDSQKSLPSQTSNTIGTASAPVKIEEFADFQCPACAIASPIVEQIINKYSDKIYFTYKHFPLPQHKNALAAANAAEAIAQENKFFDMASALYSNQDKWSSSASPSDEISKLAEQIGGDSQAVKDAIKENKYRDKIESDKKEGEARGIEATPTFFVNGVKYEGAQSADQWNKIINDILNSSN